jgi:hypothetical protein
MWNFSDLAKQAQELTEKAVSDTLGARQMYALLDSTGVLSSGCHGGLEFVDCVQPD